MKKKAIAIVIFTSMFSFTHAQIRKEDKWGCSIAINSIQAQVEVPLLTGPGALLVDADGNILIGGNRIDKSFSFSVVPKLILNNDFLLRLELGYTDLRLQSDANQLGTNGHVIVNTKVSSIIYRSVAGFQWFFLRTNKLESYCGITASYINYKSVNYEIKNEHRNGVNDTLISNGKGQQITPGGFSIGVGALAGFSIYLSKRISVGAELSSSAFYYSLGGTTNAQEEQYYPSPTVVTTSSFKNTYKGFKISKIISSFNISFWL